MLITLYGDHFTTLNAKRNTVYYQIPCELRPAPWAYQAGYIVLQIIITPSYSFATCLGCT